MLSSIALRFLLSSCGLNKGNELELSGLKMGIQEKLMGIELIPQGPILWVE